MNSAPENSLNAITGYKDRFQIIQDANILSGFKFSDARNMEFDYFKKYKHTKNLKKILEFPADGLYLNKIFPNAKIDKADLVTGDYSSFPEKLLQTDFLLKNISRSYYDAIFCVTPIHHATDSEINLFLSACHSCLKEGGILVIAEVMLNSKTAHFLDGFVNDHSLTAHKGNYPSEEFIKKMELNSFENLSSRVINVSWVFNNEIELTDCVSLIFGLKKLSHTFLLNALNELLGVTKIGEKFHLNWELVYFDGCKK